MRLPLHNPTTQASSNNGFDCIFTLDGCIYDLCINTNSRINRMTTTKLYALIQDAIDNGINPKLLYVATGLDAISFGQYFTDMLFTNSMQVELIQVIKEWQEGK